MTKEKIEEATDDTINEPIKPELTLGQYRVGINFNPSGMGVVDIIKEKTAELIDQLEDYKKEINKGVWENGKNYNRQDEIDKLIEHAQTMYEDSAMWAVKAVTKK